MSKIHVADAAQAAQQLQQAVAQARARGEDEVELPDSIRSLKVNPPRTGEMPNEDPNKVLRAPGVPTENPDGSPATSVDTTDPNHPTNITKPADLMPTDPSGASRAPRVDDDEGRPDRMRTNTPARPANTAGPKPRK